MQPLTASVDGVSVTAFLHPSATPDADAPLLVALHGGTFTSEYFTVAGSHAGSFVDTATRNGFAVLRIDRPGYGASDLLPEADNTFARQAELLDGAISAMVGRSGHSRVVVVGHSIGGMIALELAARNPSGWELLGVAVTGMGARIPAGGAAEQLGALPLSGVVDLPIADRENLWYGPAGSYTDEAVAAARLSYAPAPMVELAAAPRWAAERLGEAAPAIAVPVHHALAEFDALWDSSPDARELFLSKFGSDAHVESEIVRGVGHCIDHHVLGAAVHYKQLAFAHECACRAASRVGADR